MKLVRYEEVKLDKRSDGRTVRKVLSHHFNQPMNSMALYLCEVPSGKFGEHFHSKSEEIIMFPVGGEISVNGKDYKMNNWDFVVLQPGDKHGFNGESEDIIHLAIKLPDSNDKITT